MILPRLIRQRDAPDYLGMDRNRFDQEVRPQLTEVPIGARGVAFDRYEIDAWVDDYIAAHGRPGCSHKAGTATPKQPPMPAAASGPAAPPKASQSPGSPDCKRSNFDEAMLACSEIAQRGPLITP